MEVSVSMLEHMTSDPRLNVSSSIFSLVSKLKILTPPFLLSEIINFLENVK